MCWSLAILLWSPTYLSAAQQGEWLARHRDQKGRRQQWRVTWVHGEYGGGQAEAERKRSIERLGRPETRQSIGKYMDKPYQNEVGLCSD